MRFTFFFLLLFILPLSAFTQPEAKNFPNMVVYHPSETDPYIEVYYTGSLKKLEAGIVEIFRDSVDRSAMNTKTEKGTIYGPIYKPNYSGATYTLVQEEIQSSKSSRILQFRIPQKLGDFKLLDIRLGVFRSVMAQLQSVIDETHKATYFDKDQAPNTMYLYEPEGINKNLASYLFYYSKEPIDSSMKKLAEWFVLACETKQAGSWVEDDIYRIDKLRQPAFGSADTYSLSIEHSIVQEDYHQYVIYLSNYKDGDTENNYEVRPHDIHIRLWRYYNTLLLIEKLGL